MRSARTLRRELARTLLPFAWLVVLVQLVLPIGAVQAMSRLAQDPFARPDICTMSSSDTGDTAPAPLHGHQACPICQIGGGSAPILLPPPAAVPAIARTAVRVTPIEASSHAPRGPPAYRAGARAPPALS